MLFNSWQFVAFIAAVFIAHWLLPDRFRWLLLLAASMCFYLFWNVKYIVVLLTVSAVTYAAGIAIEQTDSSRIKKAAFTAAVVACCGALYLFKYLNFSFSVLEKVASAFSFKLHPVTVRYLMPLGISFFTLQGIGYVSDVYHSRISAEKNAGIYLLFMSFFPQISSGPIARAGELIPQLRSERCFSEEKCSYACRLFIWGLFKKLVAADNLAVYVDRVYSNLPDFFGAPLLAAALLYSVQLYCDFSGYTDMARGVAGLLGIELRNNFSAPYLSSSVKEFWSRWHISLSSWLRDYVYIPLGGSRKGKIRTWVNLLVTFFISGLWHGADVTFIIWGILHAIAQITENIFRIASAPKKRMVKTLRAVAVFAFVTFAWIFFRAETVPDAAYVIRNMFLGANNPAEYFALLRTSGMTKGAWTAFLFRTLAAVLPVAAYDALSVKRDVIADIGKMKESARVALAVFSLAFIFVFKAAERVSFVYFQF